MTKYNTWDEYLASEQDVYLVPDNRADCNVELHYDGFAVYGKTDTDLFAYEICIEHEEYYKLICILTNAHKSDVFYTLTSLGCPVPISDMIDDKELMDIIFDTCNKYLPREFMLDEDFTNKLFDEIHFRVENIEVFNADDIKSNIKACIDYIIFEGLNLLVREIDDCNIWEYCD